MTNDVVACWTSRNKLPTRKRLTVLRYSCSGIFFSFHKIHFYLMLANINLLEYIDLILDCGSSSCPSPAKKKLALNKKYCYIAGNFFQTACALIGYFEVTWHLTIKLFPAKISRRATLQNLRCQRVTVHCYLRMLTDDRSYIHRRNS